MTEKQIQAMIEAAPLIRENTLIEVLIMPTWGEGLRLYIDYGKDIAYKVTRYDDRELVELNIPAFTSKLCVIVSSWEEKMVNPSILDGVSYRVKINKGGKDYDFYGQNKFPDNFDEFLYLLHCNDLI